MFIVLLRFAKQKDRVRELMAAHNEWIRRGFDDGVFLLVGSLHPRLGGAVLAHDTTHAELEARLLNDPFVAHDVVNAEVLEISPTQSDPRLAFLVT